MPLLDLSVILTQEVIEPRWIVKDFLPAGTLVTLAGEPGVGKSLLSYALAYAVAGGSPFLGHLTTPGRVVYFDEENSTTDCAQYNQWIWHGLGCPDPEALIPRLHIHHFSLLKSWKGPILNELQTFNPSMVIFDTATPCFHVKEENDNSEATEIIQWIRTIQRDLPQAPTVLVLKHEKQRDEVTHRRTIRGAKAWLGAADQTLYHVRGKGAPGNEGRLRKTAIEPDKVRAWGLRNILDITPEWSDKEHKGVILNAEVRSQKAAKGPENKPLLTPPLKGGVEL